MKHYRICFIGFGNVGRALARLLSVKAAELEERHGIVVEVVGVATRRLGWLYSKDQFDVNALLERRAVELESSSGITEWLKLTRPDVVFETTSLDPESGQPAIDYLRAVLESGAHAITANKGPVVYGYEQLRTIAAKQQKRLLFESAVLDSAPIFSLFRETLPLVKVRAFSGIFNSTTNIILETMEEGRTFAEGMKTAQDLGVAETDPTNDIDGWDATMKVCAIANVILGVPLAPEAVQRESIRGLTTSLLREARAEGRPYKLVSTARVHPDGKITATVRPEQMALTDPLGGIRGTSLGIHFELDMIPGLTVISHRPNLQSTAYGLFADFVNAAKDERVGSENISFP